MMRCAIYARYSTDLQRDNSIDDQVRKCRAYAERNGWRVLDDYVLADRAVSGASIAGRDSLQLLVELAKRKPRPFDVLLVEDSSRLGRNVVDTLRITEILKFNDVVVVCVSQGISSGQELSRSMFALTGIIDEQYIAGVSHKVHRGAEGRVLRGYTAGGRCFGYKNVPIEDQGKSAKYGRKAVLAVRLEIDPEQAEVVIRIFEMCAQGMSLSGIAKTLNSEGIQSPQAPRGRQQRAWCVSSIREMLRNEKYRGIHVWNRTKKQRNPETGKKTSRPRPESEWQRVEVPEWRIVSDELWDAAHAQIKTKQRFGAKRLGGMSRTESCRAYLFSGILHCGVCGARMVIIAGNGKRGYVKYGCPSHRNRGTCANSLLIRLDRLEAQLIGSIRQRLLSPAAINRVVNGVERALKARHTRPIPPANDGRKAELQAKAQRLAAAISEIGHSSILLAELRQIEKEIVVLESAATRKPPASEREVRNIRALVVRRLTDLSALFQADPQFAKAKLRQFIPELILIPKQTADGAVYEVRGNLELLTGGCEMQVVARDGIEPPTPAFSECK